MTFQVGQLVECVLPEAELKAEVYVVLRSYKRPMGFEHVFVGDLFTHEPISVHGWVVDRFRAITLGS